MLKAGFYFSATEKSRPPGPGQIGGGMIKRVQVHRVKGETPGRLLLRQ